MGWGGAQETLPLAQEILAADRYEGEPALSRRVDPARAPVNGQLCTQKHKLEQLGSKKK